MSPEELQALLDQAGALAGDEVVTRALSRDVALPGGAGTAVLITLDNGHDHSRPNSLGPHGLASLNSAIDAALARDDIAAIAITGKPFIFAAGADLTLIGKITDREQAVAIGRIGHAVFDKLHTSAGAHLHLPQRPGPGRWPGDRAPLPLPDGLGARRRNRPARVLPRHAARLGRGLSAAQPDRCRRRGHGDHRERPEPEPDAHGSAGPSAGDRRRELRRSRFPRAFAGVGRGRWSPARCIVDRAEMDRGDGWTAAIARGREIADEKTSGAAPGPVPGAGADRTGADGRAGSPRSPPRTPRSPT